VSIVDHLRTAAFHAIEALVARTSSVGRGPFFEEDRFPWAARSRIARCFVATCGRRSAAIASMWAASMTGTSGWRRRRGGSVVTICPSPCWGIDDTRNPSWAASCPTMSVCTRTSSWTIARSTPWQRLRPPNGFFM